MDDDNKIPDRKASPKKTAIFFTLALLSLILLASVIWAALRPAESNTIPTMPSTSTQAPDPVKADIPPNGGPTPSPTGTGPGSNNSLLGPNEP